MRPAGADRLALGAKGTRSRPPRPGRPRARARGRPSPAAACAPAARPTCSCPGQLLPQLPGGDAVPVRRHQPRGQEPGAQAEVAAVQHRPGGHRDLALAGRALQGQPLAPEFPALVVAAGRAAEPVGPALLEQPAAQAASSGNRASNSGSDRGSSAILSPPTRSHPTYSATGTKGMSHCSRSTPMPAPPERYVPRDRPLHRARRRTRQALRRQHRDRPQVAHYGGTPSQGAAFSLPGGERAGCPVQQPPDMA